jgi:hypothetical protein
MQSVNSKISEQLALLGFIAPISQGAGAVSSAYVDMSVAKRLMAVIQTGVLGASATVDAKLQQATDSGGTGVKDVTGKSITQLVKASNDNNVAIINVNDDELDVANGFRWVRVTVTVGTAASLVSAALLGGQSFEPASDSNPVTVVQVV